MKAIIRTKAGKEFSTMRVQELEPEKSLSNQLLVRMKSSRINPVDMQLMKGFPALKYKKPQIGGISGSGEVLEIGSNVEGFEKGDAVFFCRKFSDIGSWAEDIVISSEYVAKIPTNVSLQDAGAIIIPLLTVYDSLQQLNPKKEEHILIQGAGGGVGFVAAQVFQHMGLKVIATAGEKDREALEKLGLEQFIDYKTEDFTEILKDTPPDYVFDGVGQETLLKSIQLKPRKVLSIVYFKASMMKNVGVQMPGIVRFLLNMRMRKFGKTADRNRVELIGQITGANGRLLQEASNFISQMNLVIKPYESISLTEIDDRGLSSSDVGKIIILN